LASTAPKTMAPGRGPMPLDEETVRRIATRLEEGEAGVAARLRALEVYREQPLPRRSLHLWRYTDPAALMPDGLGPLPAEAGGAPGPVPGRPAAAVLLRPGEHPGIEGTLPAGVTVEPLDGGDPRLGRAVPEVRGPFEAMNRAAFDAGVLVRVAPGTAVEGPVWIRAASGGGAFLPRILVDVGEGATVTVVEEHVGGAGGFRIAVTEILAGPGARVEHVPIQRLDDGARGHLTVRTVADAGASVATSFVSLGGTLVKMDLGARLAGEGASSELLGFLLGGDGQRFDHHTVHRHEAPRGRSDIGFRTVLTGRSRSAYTGLIRIEQEARGVEAYQENRNLLLSKEARADTIPELEILNEDVQCTHGATVSPVDPDQAFYLESRGLDPVEAERLIVGGFLEPTLARVPGGVRELLEPVIAARLEALGAGR